MFGPRALRKVPAQGEGVGPGAGRQVEPDRRALDQDRGEPVVRCAPQEPGVDADRVHVGLAYAEHPEVGPTAPDRPAHLIGKHLERDLLGEKRPAAGARPPSGLAAP